MKKDEILVLKYDNFLSLYNWLRAEAGKKINVFELLKKILSLLLN